MIICMYVCVYASYMRDDNLYCFIFCFFLCFFYFSIDLSMLSIHIHNKKKKKQTNNLRYSYILELYFKKIVNRKKLTKK